MPRQAQVVLPRAALAPLLERLSALESVTGVQVSRDGSVSPPGDVVTIVGTNHVVHDIYRIAAEPLFQDASVSTTELRSVRARPQRNGLSGEDSELAWEELGFFFRKETNPTLNFLLLMLLAGVIAAVGLWQDIVHIVVGAMILTPGFEPIIRMTFATLAPKEHLWRAALATFGGYLTLAVGALLLTLVFARLDPAAAESLPQRQWIGFWTTIGPGAWALAIVGGAAGAITLTADRPVFTAGVMVALALIPSMAIVGMAVAVWEPGLALAALVRWLLDFTLVAVAGGAVFLLKHRLVHRREVSE